jgi:phosphoglycerate dehydrogenase-like enzyme
VIGSHGTGVDSIDLDAARARGIAVVNTPGSNARSVAEHALALMLAAARLLPQADREIRKGNFSWRLGAAGRGIELSGRQLGLWGYGHIARHLGRIAQGIGMQVLALSAHATDAELAAGGARRAQDADELLAGSDVLSLHGVPGLAPLLGPEQLMRMRQGAILVNTARGALLDEAALVDALKTGHLRAAALDVFTREPLPATSPLIDCPNLILTPHIGGITAEAMQRTAEDVAMAVLRALGIAR